MEPAPPGEPLAISGVDSEGTPTAGADLLAAVRRGDPAAFDALARQHAPSLFRVALRLTGRREVAEDLVQETLVRALPKLRGLEGRATPATYLFRALANLWKNQLRSKSRSRLVDWFRGRGGGEADERDFDPPDPRPLATEKLESRDRAAEIREAVARLEPTRRLTLLLREIEGMSYEEIAEATAVPVGTVRSRLARARDDLRRLLEGLA